MKRSLFPLVALLLTFAVTSHAQDFWTRANGPYGNSSSLTFAGADSSHEVYGRVRSGIGFFRTMNGGHSWDSLGVAAGASVIANFAITDLRTLPSGEIFLSLTSGAIYHSIDNGSTWLKRDSGITPGSKVGTLAYGPGWMLALNPKSALWQTKNGGAYWARLGVLPDSSGPAGLTCDGSGNAVVTSVLRNIYLTRDGGDHWTKIDSLSKSSSSYGTFPFFDRDHILYVCQSSSIFRTVDYGTTWDTLRGPSLGLQIIVPVAKVLFGPSLDGLYRSTDSAAHWQRLNIPGSTVYTLTSDGRGTLFASSDAGGYLSHDLGTTWSDADTGISFASVTGITTGLDGAPFVTTSDRGVFGSSDVGESWKNLAYDPSGQLPLTIEQSPFGELLGFNLGNYTLYYSADGAKWYPFVDFPTVPIAVSSLAASRVGVVYACTNHGFFSTSDHGNTWIQDSTYGNALRQVVLDSAGQLFATVSDTMVVTRDTGATTWTKLQLSSGGTTRITSMMADSHSTLYFATSSELWITANHGGHWLVATLPPSTSVKYMTVDDAGRIFIATDTSVYWSQGGALPWHPVYKQFPASGHHAFVALAASSKHRVLLADNVLGVFYASTGQGAVSPTASTVPTGLEAYPNPARDHVELILRGANAATSVIVVNAIGATVAELQGKLTSDGVRFRLETSRLAAGVYLARSLTSGVPQVVPFVITR